MNKRKKASTGPKRKGHATEPDEQPAATTAAAEPQEDLSVTAASKPAAAPAPTSLTLAAECLVTDASSLKTSLSALLDQTATVTLDVSALQRVDTAAMQVITAFVRERSTRGQQVEWQGTAPVFTTAAQLLGLTSLLRLPA